MTNSQPPHESAKDRSSLRSRLKELKDSKAAVVADLQKVSGRIKELISQIQEKKKVRNSLTDTVKELKSSRTAFSAGIREKIALAKSQPPSPSKRDAQGGEPPGRIRACIDELNRKIETEAPSFEKEQQFMRQIKLLKVQLEVAQKAQAGWQAQCALSKEINELKRQADAVHESMQAQARQSQAVHEEILSLSKEIDALKEKESSLQQTASKVREELAEVQASLQVQDAKNLKKEKEGRERREKAEGDRASRLFSQRVAEVREKMKRGEKITTEDLIVLQGEEDVEKE